MVLLFDERIFEMTAQQPEAVPAAPTYKQVIAAWNSQADEHNQWEELGEDEKIEWATTYASAAQQEPSYTAVQLAEMVLSDCGHSSNNTPLLDRVAERIDAHVERRLDELRCCLESKLTPKSAAVAEQEPVAHDEELLEQMYWEFDDQRRRTGEERLTFKGKMRTHASEFRRSSDDVLDTAYKEDKS